MYIVLAILVFGILIAVHELGHFFAAKSCGVRVVEFSIGMGPVVLKKQGRETLYSWRLLPIGGFCAMEGEDEESADPRAFSNQSVWKRLIILVAGSGMNFIFGFILITALFSQASGFVTSTIESFYPDCPYEGADGLLAGDKIYSIDGDRIYLSSNVSMIMSRSKADSYDIVVIRDGEKVRLDGFHMVPVEYEVDGEIQTLFGLRFKSISAGIGDKITYSWYCARDFVRIVKISLIDLVTGAVGIKQMSGPVGIVDMMNQVGQEAATVSDALYDITYLSAFIAINLAVMNLLPIPALDGGRILFMAINLISEKVFRRKVNPKYEGAVHGAFLVLLFALMAVVMFNDIMRIIRG